MVLSGILFDFGILIIILQCYRGLNGVNVVRISPSETMGSSLFEFIMNTDVKGRIPKMAIRSTTKSFLVSYTESLKKYIDQNAAKYL